MTVVLSIIAILCTGCVSGAVIVAQLDSSISTSATELLATDHAGNNHNASRFQIVVKDYPEDDVANRLGGASASSTSNETETSSTTSKSPSESYYYRLGI